MAREGTEPAPLHRAALGGIMPVVSLCALAAITVVLWRQNPAYLKMSFGDFEIESYRDARPSADNPTSGH
jgi:hypothetical protein